MVPHLEENVQHKLEWDEVIKNKEDIKLRGKEVKIDLGEIRVNMIKYYTIL